MTRSRQIKATFYLPVVDNDGTDLISLIQEVEEACFAAFGAWTLVGHYQGAWRMTTGERQLDTSVVYSIVISAHQLPELRRILLRFKARTSQEAIYVEINHDVDRRLW